VSPDSGFGSDSSSVGSNMRPATWQPAQGAVQQRPAPVGLSEDAFDSMFGGMGSVRGANVVSSPLAPGGARMDSDLMTSSNERGAPNKDAHTWEHLHPDTLRPMPRHQHSPPAGTPHHSISPRTAAQPPSVGGGWAVGFVVADSGVIRKVVAGTPADKACLQQESASGVWQVF